MGSDLRYNLINSFRSIDAWRANIVHNMMGSVTPGFKKRDIFLGVKSGNVDMSTGIPLNSGRGSQAGAQSYNSELIVQGYKISPAASKPSREQDANATATHLSIVGDGFFAVAESKAAGARVFFTRNGSFTWKQTGTVEVSGTKVPIYNLVNPQGLLVLRQQDIAVDPATGQTKVAKPPMVNGVEEPVGMVMSAAYPFERDGYFTDASKATPGRIKGLIGESVSGDISGLNDGQLVPFYSDRKDHDSDLAVVKIPGAANLVTSGYGSEVYAAPVNARQGIVADSVRGWFRREGVNAPHVLPQSLEYMDAQSTLRQLEIESESANFVYRNLSTFLQDYNKAMDDLLGIVR
ncbi:MAG TPA: hypothetical protein V6D00_01260 [Pantanalinema sp.]